MWQAPGPSCSTLIQTASWSQSTRISTTRWTWPELSPLRHSALRERLKYQASPVSMVLRERLGVHVRDHQHVAGRRVGRDAGDEPVGVELRREREAFLDLLGRAAWRKGRLLSQGNLAIRLAVRSTIRVATR